MGFLFGGAPATATTNKAKKNDDVSPKSVAVDTGGEDSPAAAAERTKQRQIAGNGIFPSTSQATNKSAEAEESPRKAAERIRQKHMQGNGVFGAPPAANRPSGPVSSNAFASAAATNSFNVMTGRPSSRVLAPPGGKSQIRLG